jgi:ATP-dependent 26S proteasome regulatory subunit
MRKNSDEKLVEQYTSRDPGLIARYLGVKRYKMKEMSKVFPGYKKALFCKAVSEVCKSHEERVSFNLTYNGVVPAAFQHLEVGRGKHEELMTCGYRLLVKESVPLAVSIEQDWMGNMILTLEYSELHSKESIKFVDDVVLYMKENNFYIGEKIDVTGKFLSVQDIDFDSVVLPESHKKSIKVGALEFFNKKEIYTKNNLPFKRGLIFTGVPGTGKTLTGKILMNKSDATFLWVTADVLGRAGDVKSLFTMAKELSPCILFMEDIDDYLELDGAVDVLKTQMDGMDGLDGIVTILCTNHPDKLPMALIDRPSRFDDVILFQLPDLELRFSILDKVGKEMNIENRNNILKDLAEKTEGLTGSHLKEIMVYALLLAADSERENITEDDLAQALIKVLDTKETITDKLSEVNVKCLVDEIKNTKESNNNE